MHDTEWIVVLGGIAAFLNAVTVGEPGSHHAFDSSVDVLTVLVLPRRNKVWIRSCNWPQVQIM